MTRSPNKLIPADFATVPGLDALDAAHVHVGEAWDAQAIGIGVPVTGEVPAELGFDREALKNAGFEGAAGTTLVLPRADGPDLIAVGLGEASEVSVATLREAGAAVVRAAASRSRIALRVDAGVVNRVDAISALVEGALLARYRYVPLLSDPKHVPLEALTVDLGTETSDPADDDAAVRAALVTARAAVVARDLANTPPGHLTATDMGEIAMSLGRRFGFDVETHDRDALIAMGCGGLLGVNQGSAEEPRMIVLRYRPSDDPTGRLGLIGKGIMYDSGGISLKPSDPMHLLMKMDMGGAAAVLGAFTALRDAGATAEVLGWLMCTDNMPSGSAYKLGDVLTARGGTTIEVKNTDAEGRLAMSDAFALANEEDVDAIIDIATLTGAALISLGAKVAALLGNDERMIGLLKESSATTDEAIWQLPLERRYRTQLDSDIADISNLGGPYGGTITAALFLDHFTGGTPWAHLDIAGTMQTDSDDSWRTKGATGFGARLLLDVARRFTRP
ncbi:leucyl aminopeptidase family protein [Microbacterium arabinogalactanolyticum]|uniref:leucyl aminopeptidase family protein n=1 Tax=Microbacterium arabinogalactanolyticum TaxID=69365 RepID=UPI0025560AAB|nr:leucyl aminopeptidase [Microbacterium arabinogalactanolyticum]GLC85426.1 putative cytosol aminopeptidase [Microbacterium arabinogalactanolyticum]